MVKDRKPTVIIIDGNTGIRELYAAELTDRGYDVVAMGYAAIVEETISRSKPDLIILDPWIGGEYRWDVLRSIKEGHPLMPVLICLAFDAPCDFTGLAEGIVVKSSFTADLLLKVEQITQARKPAPK